MSGHRITVWISRAARRWPWPAAAGPGGSRRLTRWAWTADATLAVFLAAATVYAASHRVVGDTTRVTKVGLRSPAIGALAAGPPRPPAPPLPPHVPRFPEAAEAGLRYVTSAPWWLLALAALSALPLAFRRRWPLPAYGAVVTATLAFQLADRHPRLPEGTVNSTLFSFVSCLIAAYSAALYGPDRGPGRPTRRPAAAALLAGAVVFGVFHDDLVPAVAPGFVPIVLLVPIALAANTVHTWRQRMRTMEAEQEAATRLAVDLERARIARELHDVVTHNVSMMTVQAGAARTVLGSEPEQARQALLAVESAGRAALGELRHVMGLLAMTSDPRFPEATALTPQPGLGEVDALADRVRGTGVPVELTVTGSPVPLPAGVDLAAYRVAQEALTNTVKHAAGAHVSIHVDYRPGEVRVEVADTGGSPSAAAGGGNGRGLMGLRERLAVYGGTLDAGRRLTGGYRVRAVIPVTGSVAEA
ncbi:sensor histidine kinase [Actinacidiphila yanglinensis]|uniref:sensor histidine kinase n=1 Tax=Actinacidiphila yanglinensis TaxID=310779 RepID=UPI001F2FC0E3|nr:histidine kinase [Actinacidiphila yanglinensis]